MLGTVDYGSSDVECDTLHTDLRRVILRRRLSSPTAAQPVARELTRLTLTVTLLPIRAIARIIVIPR